MSGPQIITNESSLRIPCETVIDVWSEGQNIADLLFQTLKNTTGIGLAANQIGLNKRVCVISVPQEDGVVYNRRFINPEIIELNDPIIFGGEGCLSFPQQSVKTLRYSKVKIKCSLHTDGLSLSGLEAVALQHEIDHLNGIIMHDRKINKIGVNDKCPCMSGKKFKKCCQKKVRQA